MPIPEVMAPAMPAAVASAFGAAPACRLRPNAPFLLVHFVGREGSAELATEGLEEPMFLPVLRRYPLVAGAVGTSTVEAGERPESAYEGVLLGLARQRVQVLPARSAPGSAEYQVSDACAWEDEAGRHHRLWCEQVISNDNPEGQDLVVLDRAAYNRWRRDLVAAGLLQAPPATVTSQMVRRAQKRIDDAAQVREDARRGVKAAAEERLKQLRGVGKPGELRSVASGKTKGRDASEEAKS